MISCWKVTEFVIRAGYGGQREVSYDSSHVTAHVQTNSGRDNGWFQSWHHKGGFITSCLHTFLCCSLCFASGVKLVELLLQKKFPVMTQVSPHLWEFYGLLFHPLHRAATFPLLQVRCVWRLNYLLILQLPSVWSKNRKYDHFILPSVLARTHTVK